MSVAAELSVEGVLNTIVRGLAGKILGVLALFSREYLSEQDSTWIGIFAKQAAVAIANARAFEEIARLRKQLEIENANLHEQMKESFAFGEIVVDAARCDLAFADYHSRQASYYRSKKWVVESTTIYWLLSKKLGEGSMDLVAPLKF